MIDPVIFSREIFGITLTLRWYGVIVMTGVIIGSLIAERELRRRGENGDRIWDALIWLLPVGILGARLWFVVNAILGGNRSYIENPASIIRVWEGGLHIFGGFLFGAAALLIYLRRNKLDPWLFFDAAGPAILIGQGIGRIANFINQELYGPPTTLPWGIPIQAEHRLIQYRDLNLFPVETTRFHPTFAYEMLWNFAAAGLLLWLSRRYRGNIKPGTIFAGWLLLAGFGRLLIEFFRPDQPKIPELGISYTSIFSALMAIIGAVMLMVRYKALNLKFAENWEEEYQISKPAEPVQAMEEPVQEKKSTRVKNSDSDAGVSTKTRSKTLPRKMARPETKTKKTS
ncbi:MAG TPA: prolipoprotein diacylglyceryl transferase [Anaerolineales bacterium]|jgi:phosphatidylglycerol:prolipoprotein diacylglycerol transferase|nr:prolipoprotein diacylglyceryl transferase [Anaerolineales bacterium]